MLSIVGSAIDSLALVFEPTYQWPYGLASITHQWPRSFHYRYIIINTKRVFWHFEV